MATASFLEQIVRRFQAWPGVPWVEGLVILALLAALRVWLDGGPDLPYVAAEALLTPAERAFFGVLRQAAGRDFVLFAKVRLGDILQIERGVEGKRRFAAFGRISSKHADFVLCDPRTFQVAVVIELDDRSHRLPSRRQRDAFFDAALARAAVPLLRVPAARNYSVDTLRAGLEEALRRQKAEGRK